MDETETSAPHSGYIYHLVDPRVGEPRYVGWTIQPEARLRKHVNAGRAKKQTYVARWIGGLLKDGVKPEMIILEENPACHKEAEKAWIARYRAVGYRLTNLTDGGDGATGYRHTPEERQRCRERLLGKPLSAAHRAAMSAARKGVPMPPFTPEHRANMSRVKRGKKQSPEVAARSREVGRAALIKLNKSRIGIPRSAETKAKMSATTKGRTRPPRSAEWNAKLSEAAKNRSVESRARHSAALKALPPLACGYCSKQIRGGRGNLLQHERSCKAR